MTYEIGQRVMWRLNMQEYTANVLAGPFTTVDDKVYYWILTADNPVPETASEEALRPAGETPSRQPQIGDDVWYQPTNGQKPKPAIIVDTVNEDLVHLGVMENNDNTWTWRKVLYVEYYPSATANTWRWPGEGE